MSNNNHSLRVLLVGATGVFGSRLAEGLMRESGIKLILAGRTLASLEKLRHALGGEVDIVRFDRSRANSVKLSAQRADIVIDAAGPFQNSNDSLVEAAISAGCHYIDLADGRDFVKAVSQHDAAAREQGVLVLSGASSTPALSHAVLDYLTNNWTRIDTIRVAISPGNRAPRGLSVVRAILSYAGRPVRVFRQGNWTEVPGWGLTQKLVYPGIGPRLASLCETPDLDLLVERFQPTQEAIFLAGLELPILHHGLSVASMVVRARLIPSLAPFARPARFLAALLEPLGSDRGGMVVDAVGRDRLDKRVSARWSLTAEGGNGLHVPTLAALALIRRLRDGTLARTGAAPCVGYLELFDFQQDFNRLGITTITRISDTPPDP